MLEKERDLAIKAAHEAGKQALDFAGRPVDTQFKEGKRSNPVTEVDVALDHFLRKQLQGTFSGDAWLSEEQPDDGSRLKKDRCWVVDPIDGTTSYVKWLDTGMPDEEERQLRRQFSISIALLEEGEPVLGVVYAPLSGQMISAVRGQGVMLNGQDAARRQGPEILEEAVYLASVSETRSGLLDFLPNAVAQRMVGSVAYKMALTGVGHTYVTGSVKPKSAWDVAAGDLICRESGLVVTDLAGKAFDYTAEQMAFEGLIAAPVHLYEVMSTLFPKAPTGTYE